MPCLSFNYMSIHSYTLSLTSWHASCYAILTRQSFPLSASLAALLGNKYTGMENAMQIEQFKAGLIGLAQVLLCILASGDGPRDAN